MTYPDSVRFLYALGNEIKTAKLGLDRIRTVLEALGFQVWFRYQKYREEFTVADVIVAIDETPVGVWVEIEGGERGIAVTAEALGRGPGDYLLDSYRNLFVRHCEQSGVPVTDMLFDDE